mgnify:FL=1
MLREDEDPFPRKIVIKYFTSDNRFPILEAEVSYGPYESRICFLCHERLKGYTPLEDKDEFGNYFQYRFFKNNIKKTRNSVRMDFRGQLAHLSQKLSS